MSETKNTGLRGRFRRAVSNNLPYIILLGFAAIFVSVYFYDRVFVSIRSGEAGVLYRRFQGGTVVDYVYPEGFHVVAPWNRMYVYNVRHQLVNHSFEVLTKKGLPITVQLAIRYKPESGLVGVLHQRIGPEYLTVIVMPEVEATIRAVLGQYDVQEIYTTKRSVVQTIINESFEQAAQKYVTIDDVLITRIELPKPIREAIETKLVEEQKYAAYEFKLKRETEEAERKRIEAVGIRDYQKIVAETLSPEVLKFRGVEATRQLAESENSKVVVIGAGSDGLPIILGGDK